MQSVRVYPRYRSLHSAGLLYNFVERLFRDGGLSQTRETCRVCSDVSRCLRTDCHMRAVFTHVDCSRTSSCDPGRDTTQTYGTSHTCGQLVDQPRRLIAHHPCPAAWLTCLHRMNSHVEREQRPLRQIIRTRLKRPKKRLRCDDGLRRLVPMMHVHAIAVEIVQEPHRDTGVS